MISIKAISAIALAGLGAATVSTDVYLATQKPQAPAPIEREVPLPAPPRVVTTPVVKATAPPPPLEIEPVVIYGRRTARPAPVIKQELVACSEWHSLATGPAGRGVRTLCTRDVTE